MKARHEFKTDEDYDAYIRMYFIGKILSGTNLKDISDFESETTENPSCFIVNLVDDIIKTSKL